MSLEPQSALAGLTHMHWVCNRTFTTDRPTEHRLCMDAAPTRQK
jgi:hypothetical protein